MPQVGMKVFPYTAKGKADAKKADEKAAKKAAKKAAQKKPAPTMKDMEKNRPASKNDIKNRKRSGPKSWNNGFTK